MSIHADAQSGFRHTFLPPPVVIPSLYSVAVFSSWRSPSVRASTSPPLPRVFSTPKRPTSNPLGRFSPRRFFHVLALYVRLASRQNCVDAALNAALLLFSFFPQLDPARMLLFIPSLALAAKRPALLPRVLEGGAAIGPLPLTLLPNWAFDCAMAQKRLGDVAGGRQLLVEALRRWPGMPREMRKRAVGVERGDDG